MAILTVGDGLLPVPDRPRRAEAGVRARCATRGVSPASSSSSTWAVHRLGARPGGHRDPVLVQRRPLAQRLAGLLAALVVGRSDAVDLPRPRVHPCARPQPRAGGARHGDRHAARRAAGARAGPLARSRIRRRQLADADPAGHPGDRDGGVAAGRVHPALDRALRADPPRHPRAGGRPGDVLALLRGGDRPQPPGLDRPAVRGGGPRPRRHPGSRRCAWCWCRCCCPRSWPAC